MISTKSKKICKLIRFLFIKEIMNELLVTIISLLMINCFAFFIYSLVTMLFPIPVYLDLRIISSLNFLLGIIIFKLNFKNLYFVGKKGDCNGYENRITTYLDCVKRDSKVVDFFIEDFENFIDNKGKSNKYPVEIPKKILMLGIAFFVLGATIRLIPTDGRKLLEDKKAINRDIRIEIENITEISENIEINSNLLDKNEKKEIKESIKKLENSLKNETSYDGAISEISMAEEKIFENISGEKLSDDFKDSLISKLNESKNRILDKKNTDEFKVENMEKNFSKNSKNHKNKDDVSEEETSSKFFKSAIEKSENISEEKMSGGLGDKREEGINGRGGGGKSEGEFNSNSYSTDDYLEEDSRLGFNENTENVNLKGKIKENTILDSILSDKLDKVLEIENYEYDKEIIKESILTTVISDEHISDSRKDLVINYYINLLEGQNGGN